MAGLLVNKLSLITILLLFNLEFFFFLCYDYVIFFTKLLKLEKTKKTPTTFEYLKYNELILTFILLMLVFMKDVNLNFFFLYLIISICFYFLIKILNQSYIYIKFNNNLSLVVLTFIIFVFFFFLIDSFLNFFFFIEVYGVLYYFVFLNSYNFTNQNILKYKNGLLFLLWNNFLTTMFLAFSCFFLLKNYGTTRFSELEILVSSSWIFYIFFFGLGWKLGLPIFHFFKIQVYEYLLKENVFFFSLFTIMFNSLIFFFFFNINVVYNTFHLWNMLTIIILFLFNLIIFNLKLTNMLIFFAFSGIITLSTVLTLFVL